LGVVPGQSAMNTPATGTEHMWTARLRGRAVQAFPPEQLLPRWLGVHRVIHC